LELRQGVPPDLRRSSSCPRFSRAFPPSSEQIERLEVHHLSNPDGNFIFALLSDWRDADVEQARATARLFDEAAAGIEAPE
jgi:cyclic beta-1,2-glucan synthetase